VGVFQAIKMIFLVQSSFHAVECILAYRAANGSSSLMHAQHVGKTIKRFMLVYDLFDYKKSCRYFEVLQNAVREKPAKREELTLVKVR